MDATSRRGWIKNIAIIFLVILLLLTFFSNTILHYSLPEVSAQYTRYDTIASAIKASGTVKANESFAVVYDEAEEGMETVEPGQTRKILSVYVKQGDTVAVGDPILALKGGASKELDEAETKLRELEKQYAVDTLNDTISDLTSSQTQSKNQLELNKSYAELKELKELYASLEAGTDPTDLLKEQKKAAEKERDAIQKQITEIEDKIAEAERKISSAEGNIKEDYTSGKPLDVRYSEAKTAFETLQVEYDALTAQVKELKEKYDAMSDTYSDAEEVRTLSANIEKLQDTIDGHISSLETTIENYYNANNGVSGGTGNYTPGGGNNSGNNEPDDPNNGTSGTPDDDTNAKLFTDDTVTEEPDSNDAIIDLKNEFSTLYSMGILDQSFHVYNYMDIEICRHKINYNMVIQYKGVLFYVVDDTSANITFRRTISGLLDSIDEAQRDIELNEQKLAVLGNNAVGELDSYIIDKAIAQAKDAYDKANVELDTVTKDYNEAKSTYEDLTKQNNSTAIIAENEQLLAVFERDKETFTEQKEAIDEKIAGLEEDITEAGSTKKPEEVKKQIDELTASISNMEMQMKIDAVTGEKNDAESAYNREDQKRQIEELKQKIEAMKTAPDQTDVVAPIAGKIVEVNYVPGNSITSGATVARIEVADKGYVCEISMSAEEARKIQVGAECAIVNSWWYSEVEAVVAQIRSDPQSQGKNRIVVINVKGDVYEGQQLNFSIGDKSQNYESVLPNSAIREDSEGKFVLVVESKNTPLSVRYTARRMNIEVIASDDTKSAVSGLYGSEFVITSAESPISDGQQVRLAEN